MIRLRNIAKRTLGITISALLTVSMMPVQAYALDDLDIVVREDQITVNGDPAVSPVDKSEEDFSSVLIDNGDYWDEVPGGQVEVSVRNVVDEDESDYAAINIYNDYGENINTDIQSGNITSSTDGIDIFSDAGSVTAAVGDIRAGDDGVYIEADGGDVTLTAGSVQAQGRGIYIDGYADDTVKVSVGDIQAGGNGIYVDADDGTYTITSGSIDADECGIYTYSWEGNANTNIEVDGNIVAGEGFFSDDDYEIFTLKSGVLIYSEDGNTNNIKVNGDVTGSMGINVLSTSSETKMIVDGNVSGSGMTVEGTETHIPGVGITYNYPEAPAGDEGDKLNVLVTDTVSGSEDGVGVVTSDDGSDFTLTTWKITPSTDKFAAGENIVAAKPNSAEGYEFVENEEFEKSIQYIVKIDPAEVAGVNSLGATKEDGSALDKEGDYEWAHEGDTLLLKVELQDGYELTNAYGKENQSYPFTKDQSGNYYITVPRGGGIFISVETAQTSSGQPVVNVEVVDDESSNDNPPTVQGAVANADTLDPVIFNSSIIRMVADAAPGANVTVAAAGNTMISKEVVDTLIARSDVSLTITYVIDGVMYSVTIPAGTNLNLYRNAAGGIDIFTLVQLFGAMVIG